MINYNNIILGVVMIMANIGIRYIHLDINKKQDKILSHPLMRIIYVFCMVLLITRDIISSALVSLGYFSIMKLL